MTMQQNGSTGLNPQPVLIYARVSSQEQEAEGFSIQAQLELLNHYASKHGMKVMQEFVDVESASTRGRTKFGEMVAFLRKNHSRCTTILVEKTDRLYRNVPDYAIIDELGVTVHFVKDGNTISPDSKSSDQFIHGIKVLMARNYSQNLGEEALKGMTQKAKSGLYPSSAPSGYRNVEGADQRRIIVPDVDAPTITRLFDDFATGEYSLKTLANKARAEGWTIKGNRLHSSTLHLILQRRLYMGDFDFNGTTYRGSHTPLVSRETWEKVQALFKRRIVTKQHRIKHDFPYTGFIRCGHCGCALVGELKLKKATNKGYIYYHCTGHRGKCGEPYTPEKVMEDHLTAALKELVIPTGVLKWLQETVSESDVTERSAREREAKRLEEQHRRVQSKLDALYSDRLEGHITIDMYLLKSQDMRNQAVALTRRIEEIRTGAPAPVQQAINLMDLTSRTAELFAVQPPHEKQTFLRLILKSASWKGGELKTEFENPFESVRRSNQLSQTIERDLTVKTTPEENWLTR